MSHSHSRCWGNEARIADGAGFAKAAGQSVSAAQFLHILIGIDGLFLDSA
jgi:hypothetical protein